MLVIEKECRFCGAPLGDGAYVVNPVRFDASNGVRTGRLTNLREDEFDGDISEIEDVKLEFGTCSDCREP